MSDGVSFDPGCASYHGRLQGTTRAHALFLAVLISAAAGACGQAVPTAAPAQAERGGIVIEDWPAYAAPPAPGAQPNGLPAGFKERFAFRDLAYPTSIAFLPDGRALVAEQRGVIKIFAGVGDGAPVTLLDHRRHVFFRLHQGLLGLAVDPDFESEPYVYVLYAFAGPPGAAQPSYGTADEDADECPGGDGVACATGARLSRFRFVDAQTLGPEQVLVDGWCGSAPTHSVGDIAWGPDGSLLAGVGDSAVAALDFGRHGQPRNVCGDPPVEAGMEPSAPSAEGGALRSQDLRTRTDPLGLNGTIIRVDRSTGAALPGNPLFDDQDANAQRIVAYGMRNPYRFDIRPGSGELWIADVGWQRYEEVNVLDLEVRRRCRWRTTEPWLAVLRGAVCGARLAGPRAGPVY